MTPPELETTPNFSAALRFWWKLGWISFGGPTGQIAIMHTELVERKKWINEARFLHGLNYCMLLPGPEAQQLATYLGWRLHGTKGGLAAGVFFVLPSVFILWALSLIYIEYGHLRWIEAAFYGIVPAVIAIVFQALFRLAQKTLIVRPQCFIAFGAAFEVFKKGEIGFCQFILKLLVLLREMLVSHPRWFIAFSSALLTYRYGGAGAYPFIIFVAGFLGWFWRKTDPDFQKASPLPSEPSTPLSWSKLSQTALGCLFAWWTPVLIAGLALGWHSTITREGLFFSQAAVITFGGAYAVLPYVAQEAVNHFGWLDAEQMLHGYGLAETTPGPLIMVLQFVGFLGAYHQPGGLNPIFSATLGALLTTWVTFAPSFLYILTGAPLIDRLEKVRALKPALGGISAAVVGVMAHFALWFTWTAILGKGEFAAGQADFFVFGLALAAFIALRWGKVGIVPLILGCALIGIGYKSLGF